MKMPCELIVWYVLPFIRKELAKELIESHGFTQAKVARMFGVSDAAISQYMKEKRGKRKELEDSEKYVEFKKEMERLTEDIAREDLVDDICYMCKMMKRVSMLAEIYKVQMSDEMPECWSIE